MAGARVLRYLGDVRVMKPIFPFLSIDNGEFLVLHLLKVRYLTYDSAPSEDGRHPLAAILLTMDHLAAAFTR
jgi:hypothetical protein